MGKKGFIFYFTNPNFTNRHTVLIPDSEGIYPALVFESGLALFVNGIFVDRLIHLLLHSQLGKTRWGEAFVAFVLVMSKFIFTQARPYFFSSSRERAASTFPPRDKGNFKRIKLITMCTSNECIFITRLVGDVDLSNWGNTQLSQCDKRQGNHLVM